MIRGSVKHRADDETGFALVLALTVVVALSSSVASVAYFTTANFHSSKHDQAGQNALALAEAGLTMAYSTLEHAPNPTVATAVSSTAVPDVPLAGGFATYYGSFDSTTQKWTLVGLGKAIDTNHPGALITRAVHGSASIGTATRGDLSNGAWKYIYSDDPNSCATFSNNTTIAVPVLVRGNLCLNNSARVLGPQIQVDGSVTLNNTQTSIGTVTSPLSEIHIGRGCSTDGVNYHSPCSSTDRVYGSSPPDTSLIAMTKPPIDLAYWSANAMPGPLHPCSSGSFPGGFDNNGVLDRSNGTVDLFPKTAYDCRVLDATGAVVGRLSWTPGAPGSLVVQGTIFIDGNISMSQLIQANYSGRGTIYASGTIAMSNQVVLCPSAGGCGSNWDPNTDLLAFVAGSSTDQYGFTIGNNSTFAGAVYTVTDFQAGNSSQLWGPIVARQLNISNSTLNNFPPIMKLMTGMPSSYSTVTTVTATQGSWSN
jgi:hypothetical protein